VTVYLSSTIDLHTTNLDAYVNIVDLNDNSVTLSAAQASSLYLTDSTGTADQVTINDDNGTANVHLNTQYATTGLTLGTLDVNGNTTVNLVSSAESTTAANVIDHVQNNVAATYDITGSHALTVVADGITGGSIIDAHSFTGTLTLTDSDTGGDSIKLGTGANTVTLSSGHTVGDTIQLASQYTHIDVVNNYSLSLDTLNVSTSAGHAATVGSELGAVSGVVASGSYANEANFASAAQALTSVTAGDVIAWSDGSNTYVAEFNATGSANHVHIVELSGVSTATQLASTHAASTITIA